MFIKLSTVADRILWINTDQIQSMEVLTQIEKGHPATNIIFQNGGSETVHESPDHIMTEANRFR